MESRNFLRDHELKSAIQLSENALRCKPVENESNVSHGGLINALSDIYCQNLIKNLVEPSEDQVEKAFRSGTKLVVKLFSEDKIDKDTAKTILMHFANLYVESKLNSVVNNYINKFDFKSLNNYLIKILSAGE